MQGNKLLGLILLVLGILALAYGGFTYTTTHDKADIGPLHIQTHEKERVNIPVWMGIAGTVGGAAMLLAGRGVHE
jgi:hypothetical protein